MRASLYWQLASFYFFYFAFVGAFAPYWTLYLQSLAFGAFQISVLMSTLQVMRIVSPNFWGFAADRSRNAVQVIRFASLCAALTFCAVFAGTSFSWIFLVMCVASFFWGGSLPLMEAATMNHLGEETAHYGKIRLWGSVGFILAVIGLGWLLDLLPIRTLPWLILALLAATAVCTFYLPASRRAAHDPQKESIRDILIRPDVRAFLAACFFMTVAHGPLYIFFSIYLVDQGYSKTIIGLLWSLGVACEIFVFMYLPRLFARYSLRSVLLFSFAVAVIRFLLIGWGARSLTVLVIAQLMHAATFGSYHCAALTLVHHFFRGPHQATGQALYTSLSFGAGGALGGLLAGAVWDRFGPGATFSLGSIAALLGIALILRYLKRDPPA